jgi:hypothetical protein
MKANVLIVYGSIYYLSDIFNLFNSADVKFNIDNEPYVIVDHNVINLTKEALSFITPLGKCL